ncbi:MAG TPA: TlpA disulfide reductase family protein, partial [Lachnospiraceae bacterium]|nr:TlpA disulfide reductase family protein [Lachnospiraceae bacterium]
MKKMIWVLAASLFVLTGCGSETTEAIQPAAEQTAEEQVGTQEDAVEEEDTAQTTEETVQDEEAVDTEETGETEDAGEAEDTSSEMTGEFASFTSVDLDGNTVDQSVIADADLTMLNIWGTYCGPCINEMPELGELADEYEGTGVQIIGVPIDVYDESTIETAKEIIDKTGADYLHILPTEDLYNILLNNVSAVPTTVFIDNTGT